MGPLVAIVEDFVSPNMYLLDTAQGFVRWLQFEGGEVAADARWIGDGCQLYVTLFDTSQPSLEPPYTNIFKVVRTDLEGNVLEEVFAYRGFREVGEPRDVWHTWTAISPTGDWFASVVKSGDFWNQQLGSIDVEVISTRNEGQRYVLTDGGDAANILAWSPDGTRLAFSDRDATGIRQLYVSSPNGTGKVQVTHFTQPDDGVTIGSRGLFFSTPVWSPDGERLAFGYRLANDRLTTASMWIVSTSGDEQLQIIPEDLSGDSVLDWGGAVVGWSEDGSQLAFRTTSTLRDNDDFHSAMYWVDTMDGSVTHVLNDFEVPGEYIGQGFPIEDIDTIVFETLSGWDLYLYDSLTGELDFISVENQPGTLGTTAIASPYDFPGEATCKAQASVQSP